MDDFRERLVPGADLRGTTFPACGDLNEIDLHGADLSGADLSEVDSWGDGGGAGFSRADLSGADLRGAELGCPDFSGANLRGANLSGLDLGRRGQFAVTDFDRADLTGADLSGINVNGGSLDRTVLDAADLTGAVLTSCSLRDASLVGASLVRADLRKTTLKSADLRGADLTAALLPDLAAFAGARFDASTRWPGSMRAHVVAGSVAAPDGTCAINGPTPPPVRQPRRAGKVVGRVAAFLLGAGMTVMAALTVTGDFVWANGAGEPITNVFLRLLTGLLYGFWGLAMVGAGILGFPEESYSGSGSSSGGGGGFEVDGCGIDVD
jgi:uncharacterized protein YjbI with pentapeptide repeats